MSNEFVTLTAEESTNLLDALREWADVVGPKQLEENEIGLDDERLNALMKKLSQFL